MSNALEPTSVDITVESFTQLDVEMTLAINGEPATFEGVALISLKANRDDVKFVQNAGFANEGIAISEYGLILIPYTSLSDSLIIDVVCAGKTGTVELNFSTITAGTFLTVALSGMDSDEGDDEGDDDTPAN